MVTYSGPVPKLARRATDEHHALGREESNCLSGDAVVTKRGPNC